MRAIGPDAGALQRLPRVSSNRRCWGSMASASAADSKKSPASESICTVEEPPLAYIAFAGGLGRVVEVITRPSARERADQILARLRALPETLGVSMPPGRRQNHTDEGDGFAELRAPPRAPLGFKRGNGRTARWVSSFSVVSVHATAPRRSKIKGLPRCCHLAQLSLVRPVPDAQRGEQAEERGTEAVVLQFLGAHVPQPIHHRRDLGNLEAHAGGTPRRCCRAAQGPAPRSHPASDSRMRETPAAPSPPPWQSRLRSSTAIGESSPSSLSVWRSCTACGCQFRTAATSSAPSSREWRALPGGSAAICSLQTRGLGGILGARRTARRLAAERAQKRVDGSVLPSHRRGGAPRQQRARLQTARAWSKQSRPTAADRTANPGAQSEPGPSKMGGHATAATGAPHRPQARLCPCPSARAAARPREHPGRR